MATQVPEDGIPSQGVPGQIFISEKNLSVNSDPQWYASFSIHQGLAFLANMKTMFQFLHKHEENLTKWFQNIFKDLDWKALNGKDRVEEYSFNEKILPRLQVVFVSKPTREPTVQISD